MNAVKIADTFGAELRRHRQAAGLTLRSLAERVPCSIAWLSKMENGAGHPTKEMAVRLDSTLSADGALLTLVNDDQEEVDMQRRAVLRALSAAGLGPVSKSVPGLELLA
ncbi:helix-turn-helix domain-containing protein [Micromonospora echinospora]|uniref:helix-turn-helix domain-containing protein n=1 Tax=Micromonospora echinospora TaxID=1877 RepID=UPI003A8ACB93